MIKMMMITATRTTIIIQRLLLLSLLLLLLLSTSTSSSSSSSSNGRHHHRGDDNEPASVVVDRKTTIMKRATTKPIAFFDQHMIPNAPRRKQQQPQQQQTYLSSSYDLHRQQYHHHGLISKLSQQSLVLSSRRRSLLSLSSYASDDDDNAAYGLLYQEQEQILIRRGIHEEQLMQHHYQEIIAPILPEHLQIQQQKKMKNKKMKKPTKVRITNQSPGFGSSSSNNNSKNPKNGKKTNKQQPKLNDPETLVIPKNNDWIDDEIAQYYATILQKDGVVRIDHILEDYIVKELRQFIIDLRRDSYDKVYESKLLLHHERYANVLLQHHRCDLKIPLMGNGDNNMSFQQQQQQYNIHMNHTNIIELALHHIIHHTSIMNTIRHAFSRHPLSSSSDVNDLKQNKSPVLYELSSLTSDPGSHRQTIHPDNPIHTLSENVPVLYTCFIALQDITEDMGPTVWLPNTHHKECHDRFYQDNVIAGSNDEQSPKDMLLRNHIPVYRGTMSMGSAVLYDSRLLHGGTANRHQDRSRSLFYFSIRHPDILYPGNPASIRKDIGTSNVDLDELQYYLNDAVTRHPSSLPKKTSSSSSHVLRNPFPWNR